MYYAQDLKTGEMKKMTRKALRASLIVELAKGDWYGMITEEEMADQLIKDLKGGVQLDGATEGFNYYYLPY